MTGVPGLAKHTVFSTDVQYLGWSRAGNVGYTDHLEVIACYG